MPQRPSIPYIIPISLLIITLVLLMGTDADASRSFSSSSSEEELPWTPMVFNSSDTVAYQAIAKTTIEPSIPRSILYYTQDYGHKFYDYAFQPDGSIKHAAYMGFELINSKQFQFNYHIELPTDIQSHPDEIKNMALDLSSKLDSDCEQFDNLLDSDSSAQIKGCYTNVTIIPLLSHCTPHTEFNQVSNKTDLVYPCGSGSCQKCSSMKGCVGDKDCIWGTSCLENICGMIASSAFTPLGSVFSTFLIIFLGSVLFNMYS